MEKEYEILNEWGAEMFAGNNHGYYQDKWRGKAPYQTFADWNWPAFLGSVYWLAYRKMYLEAVIGAVLTLILPFGVIQVLIGIFGNSMYRSKAIREIRKSLDLPWDEAKEYIERRGGTNLMAAFLTFVSVSLVTAAIIFALIALGMEADKSSALELQTNDHSVNGSDSAFGSTYDIMTRDGEIVFTLPVDFVAEDGDDSDLWISDSRDIAIIAFVSGTEDFVDDDATQAVLSSYVEIMDEVFQLSPLTEVEMPQLSDTIIQEIYVGVDEGTKIYFYFAAKKIENYYVVTLVNILPGKWKKNQELLADIISSARLAEQY